MEILKIFGFCYVLGQVYITQFQLHSRDMTGFWSLVALFVWPKLLHAIDEKQTSALAFMQ